MQRASSLRFFLIGLFILAGFLPSQAKAGNEPIFAAAPDWVEQSQTPAPDAKQSGQPVQLLLISFQTLHSANASTSYFESITKIQSAEGLTAAGTLAISWQPERSDLVIHSLEVIRDGVTRDVLADQKFSILRRENNLEAALLDGMFTATIQPEDLRVGDIVHLAYSVRADSGTVGLKPEDTVHLSPGTKASLVLVREIWPDSVPMRWAASPGMGKVNVRKTKFGNELRAELRNLDVAMPPPSAPARYASTMFVETSAYRDWAEVSALFAPLYAKAATLSDSSPLKAEANLIRAAASTPKARALAALRLVQDKIRYLALQMGEGGYIPASADETWKRRFADCKGKTAILIALLKELDIEAEPVLINAYGGDVLPNRLPNPRLFNHVFVHATIDGKSYWLDGTRSGDRDLEELASSPFGHGLPVRAAGATLIELPLVVPIRPLTEFKFTVDASAGAFAPAFVQEEVIFRGDTVSYFKAMLAQIGETELKKSFDRDPYLPGLDDRTVRLTAAPDDGSFTVLISGKARLNWGKKSDSPTPRYQFRNDGIAWLPEFKGREGANAQVPFRLDFPVHGVVREELILPNQGKGYSLLGKNFDRTVAATRIARTLTLENGRAVATSTMVRLKPEISAAEAQASTAALAEITADAAYVVAPVDLGIAKWEWSRMPNTAEDYIARGYDSFDELARKSSTSDFERTLGFVGDALADFDRAIALSPDSSLAYALRALALTKLGRLDEAEAAIDKAHSTESVHEKAFQVRGLINARRNRPEKAILDFSRYIDDYNPASVMSLFERGLAYEKTGQLEKAEADLQRVATLEPPSMTSVALARVLVRLGNTKDALAVIDKVMQTQDNTSRSSLWRPHLLAIRRGGLLEMAGLQKQGRSVYEAGLREIDTRLKQLPAPSGAELNTETAKLITSKVDLLVRMGRVPEAIAVADQVLALHPNNLPMLAARCDAHLHAQGQGLLAKARQDCDAVFKQKSAAPGTTALGEAALSSGLISLKAHEWARARSEFELLTKVWKGSPNSWFGLGIAKLRSGETDSGRAYIGLARNVDPNVDFDFAKLGITPEPGPDEATPLVSIAGLTLRDWTKSGEPETPEDFLARGYDRLKKWEMNDALADFDRAVAVAPDSSLAQSLRALALVRLGRLDEAEAAIGKALGSNPVEPKSYQIRGLLNARRGHPDKAIPDLSRNLEPGSVSAVWLLERGLAYEQTGQLEKARADLQQVVDLAPRPPVRMALARVTARLGLVADATEIVDTMVTGLNANSPPWMKTYALAMRRGRVLGMAGRLESARGEYDKALQEIDARMKQLPPSGDGRLQGVGLRQSRAELLIRMGRPQDAVAVADEALAISPDNAVMLIVRCKARLLVAGDLSKARPDCDAALQKEPANNQAVYVSGLTSLKSGEWDRAASEFDNLAKAAPRAPGAFFGRGIAKLRRGEKADGAADIEFARSLSAEVDAEFEEVGIKP